MTVGRSTAKTHQVGARFEDEAARFLQAQGLRLVCQNWHVARVGELDMVMLDETLQANGSKQTELIFVEVKRRASAGFGGAAASITPAKQRKLINTAGVYLSENPKFADLPCRFDVVVFEGGIEPVWYKAAFMAG